MLQDAFNRPLKDLRICVTDRCNYRCSYCMPLDEYAWIRFTAEFLLSIYLSLDCQSSRVHKVEQFRAKLKKSPTALLTKIQIYDPISDERVRLGFCYATTAREVVATNDGEDKGER
jgi:hypothetical protein